MSQTTDGVTTRGTWAIIPAKPLREAKSRLELVLTSNERARLALSMFDAVIDAVSQAEGLAGWVVVSRDEEILSRARSLGGASLLERSHGLNQALDQASQWCIARGAVATLVLHTDLPHLQPWELESMLQAGAGQAKVVLAPSLDGAGTNAMLLRPPSLLQFSFGSGGLARHLDAARELGLAPWLFYCPGTACDVDTPADLSRLQTSRTSGHQAANHMRTVIAGPLSTDGTLVQKDLLLLKPRPDAETDSPFDQIRHIM